MRIGSLFSGYGGLDMGVQAILGGEVAWHVEYDKAPSRILDHHWPEVPNYGDVTAVDFTAVEPVDILTGGYPCQPFSHAGNRKGTQDERHLWPHVLRAIRDMEPRLAILENVRGHLTLGFDVVLSDLADLGWSARWGVVRAADAGAPHNRARLFIVAHPERPGLQGQPERSVEWTGEPAASGQVLANTASTERRAPQPDGLQARRATELGERAGTAPNPSSERHGSRQGPAGLGRVGSEAEGSRWQASAAWQESGAGSAQDAADADSAPRKHSISRVGLPNIAGCDWGDYAPAINRWEHVIGRPAPEPTQPGRTGKPRLNPAFVEWMMGLPDGHVTDPAIGISRNNQLKALGNGVVPQQAALAVSLLRDQMAVAA